MAYLTISRTPIEEAGHSAPDIATPAALSVSDLAVSIGGTRIVHDASFSIPTGGSLGLVGESGCGKTTILRAIAGLTRNWTGSINASGRSLGISRQLTDRRLLQVVFQDPAASLNPAHTIDEILREPLIVHGFGNRERTIARAIDQVALPASVRFRFPHQLSGGQRQRISIARALLVQPKLLLLDEPTSALDVSVQAEVLNLLSQLRRELGLAFLLVSHDLSVVAHMCERVVVMQHGRFVETLTREDVAQGRARDPYSRLLFEAAKNHDA